jgi:tetratricopeptide (TPR) repeat protein
MTTRACWSAVVLWSVALAACARGPTTTAPGRALAVHFPVSCGAESQPDFDRAVTLLHHMTYPQARATFAALAARKPDCAMAQWGIAMTLFQPLWPTRPGPDDLRAGWEAVRKAQAAPAPSAREQLFIDAAAAFFREPESTDYWQRIERWEAAMAALHAAYPQDTEATVFYALALLAAARPGPSTLEHAQAAAALLQTVLRTNPDQPGAMHYLIHANDVPGREHEDLATLREYEAVAPDNPHALHMPTHIYTRLGDWEGVIRGNLRAADAALKYPSGAHGEFVSDEFPHALEYLVYAYLQRGEDARAAAEIARLLATPKLEPSAKTAFHLASTRARYALERHAWAEAAALVPRAPALVDWDRFPWPEAVSWFARGYGALRGGDLSEPARAIARMQELEAHAAAAGEEIFARQIRILRLALAGWSAHGAHDDAAALALLRQSVELEFNTPKPAVTPAPTVPAAELLGDLLLELERNGEALAAYRQSLERYPHRFNATLGVARALAASGDGAGAQESYCELLRLAPRGSRAPVLDEARRFVVNQRSARGDENALPCPGQWFE